MNTPEPEGFDQVDEDDPFNPDHDYAEDPSDYPDFPDAPQMDDDIEPPTDNGESGNIATKATPKPVANALMPPKRGNRLDGGRLKKRPPLVGQSATTLAPEVQSSKFFLSIL